MLSFQHYSLIHTHIHTRNLNLLTNKINIFVFEIFYFENFVNMFQKINRMRTGDTQDERLLLTVTFDEKMKRRKITSQSSKRHKWHQCEENQSDFENPCSEFLVKAECERSCALGARNGLCQWVPENR